MTLEVEFSSKSCTTLRPLFDGPYLAGGGLCTAVDGEELPEKYAADADLYGHSFLAYPDFVAFLSLFETMALDKNMLFRFLRNRIYSCASARDLHTIPF